MATTTVIVVSRYRLLPTAAQEAGLLEHCAHARYVWNLAVEQHSHWRPGRVWAPNYVEQGRQRNFFGGTHREPTWRKARQHEGFRQVAVKPGHVQRLNRRAGQVWVPKVGWVRFRWTRDVQTGVKSYRVTRDRAGRWHIAFAVIPDSIPAPGTGEVVGVDRGVSVAATLSTGELLICPALPPQERRRLTRNRRKRVKNAIATLTAREADRRKDRVEKTRAELARRFDLIRVEDLNLRGMTRSAKGTVERPGRNVCQKAGLNRGILAAGRAVTARGGRALAGPANREPQLEPPPAA